MSDTQQVAEALAEKAYEAWKAGPCNRCNRGFVMSTVNFHCPDCRLLFAERLAPAVVRYGRANTPYGTPSSVIRAVRAAALASLTEGT